MNEQITLNFDASEFDGYEKSQEFFKHAAMTTRDSKGEVIKQCVQAMEMDYSPSQWSQKLNKSNNTSVTLDDADKHTDLYGNVSWIYYLIHKHIIKKKRPRAELLRLKAELDAELAGSE